MQTQYDVRGDLKKALPGPYYQVLVALHHSLEALEQELKFNVMLELKEVGALDDVVFEFFDGQRKNVTASLFLQLKHSIDGTEELTEKEFVNKSGKFKIFKYFDDWYLFIKNNPEFKKAECIYYTNQGFCKELKNSSHLNGDKKQGNYQFSPNFFQGGKKSLYEKMLIRIKENSLMCNHSLLDKRKNKNIDKKIAKNPTYKAAKKYYDNGGQPLSPLDAEKEIKQFLTAHYRMRIGQSGVEELEKEVAEQIGQYFSDLSDSKAIFNAVIVETWRWFRVLGKAEIWTEEKFKKMLADFRIRFTKLPQEIGRSLSELGRHIKALTVKVDRKSLLDNIKSKIEGLDQLIVFEGKAEVGKSTLISNYLLTKTQLKLGEYLYFDSIETFLKEYKKLLEVKFLKVFIVDDIQEDSPELQTAIVAFQKKSKKLVLISRIPIKNLESSAFPVLTYAEITEHLKKTGKFDYVLTIDGKKLRLDDIVTLGKGGLYAQMQYPKYLKAICELSTPLSNDTPLLSSLLATPYIPNAQSDIKPIPLAGDWVIPLYSLEDLFHLNEFKYTKYIKYNFDDSNLKEFKNYYTNPQKFLWIDINSINLSDDDKDIKEILERKLREQQKQPWERQEFFLLLVDNKEDQLSKWPQVLVQNLFNLSATLVFTEKDFSHLAATSFILTKHSEKYYFECQTATLTQLPKGSAQIRHQAQGSIQEALQKELCNCPNAVIVAEGGAGKSTSLKLLHNEYIHSASLTWGNYHQIVFIPLNRLASLKLTTLEEVSCHFLTIKSKVLKKVIQHNLLEKKILFLLDGWDELTSEERNSIKALLMLFEKYQHMVVTTRPPKPGHPIDRTSLFFEPFRVCELQQFSSKQITEFFSCYFKDDQKPEKAKLFVDQAMQFLNNPENKQALELIGLPLQCYLLCEVWKPFFDAVCQGIEVAMPWERASALFGAELYQLFVIGRMRKFLYDRYTGERLSNFESSEEVCTLMSEYLKKLQNAAYQQICRGKIIKLGDDWFANRLSRLGLIDNTGFVHKTFAEYFLALYFTNLLLSDPHKAQQLIANYRYQAHYRLVFEFMAGIVSYGDPIIPLAKSSLRNFWEALLQPPRDCVGMVEYILITKCYSQSDKEALAEIFDKPSLFEIQKVFVAPNLFPLKNIAPSVLINTDNQNINNSIDNTEIIFIEPNQYGKYVTRASNIDELPVEKYSVEEKNKAINWLLKEMETTTSFRVKEACAAKLGAIGIPTDEVITCLLKFLDSKESDRRSDVHRTIVQSLITLETLLDNRNISDNSFEKIINYLINSYFLSNTESNWLRRQNFKNIQLDQIFILLGKGSFFSAQLAIVKNLMPNKREIVLNKISSLLKKDNELGSLHYCLLYALLQADQVDPEIYFDSIMAIKYDDHNFNVIADLLGPTKILFEKNSSIEKYKANWISKIYDFAMIAIQKHDVNSGNVLKLVIELVDFKLEPERMEHLLKALLSENTDHGYWDVDVILPSLPYLFPYFSQTYADYLVYKVTRAMFKFELSRILHFSFEQNNFTDEMCKLLIKACLQIYRIKYNDVNEDEEENVYDNSRNNPVYYIKNIAPDIVLPIILDNTIANELSFLKNYIEMSGYALTIHDNKIQVHTSGDIKEISVSAQTSGKLSKIRGKIQLLPKGITVPDRSRSPSPVEFLLEYSGIFSNKRNKRPYAEVENIKPHLAVIDVETQKPSSPPIKPGKREIEDFQPIDIEEPPLKPKKRKGNPSNEKNFSSREWLSSDQIAVIADALLKSDKFHQIYTTKTLIEFSPSISFHADIETHGSLQNTLSINARLLQEKKHLPILTMALNLSSNPKDTQNEGNHWVYCLIIVDNKKDGQNKCLIVNPASNPEYIPFLESARDQIKGTYNISDTNSEILNAGYQTDDYNCGVWVLTFLEATLDSVKMDEEKFLEFSLEDIKKQILFFNKMDLNQFIAEKREEYKEIYHAHTKSQEENNNSMDLSPN